jgi:uncharacterized Zn-binding protein involved in type VI secretion
MPSVSIDEDVAGGAAAGKTTNVTIDGKTVVCVGSVVASHGEALHAAATMTSSVTNVTMNGFVPCVSGDAATCAHTISSSSSVTIG